MSWPNEDIFYASWSSMPQHYRFCHKPSHSKPEFSSRSTRHRWFCHSETHLFRQFHYKSSKSNNGPTFSSSKKLIYILSGSESFSIVNEIMSYTSININNYPNSSSLIPSSFTTEYRSLFAFNSEVTADCPSSPPLSNYQLVNCAMLPATC